MRNLVKFTFGLAAAIILVAANASATVIADWTFESSYVSITGSSASISGIAPESGSGSASGVHANTATWSTPAGNGSSHSFSVNNWASGDYFQFNVSTLTLTGITLDWDQTGSGTGPKDFVLQYSTDNTTFTQYGSAYAVLLNAANPWSATGAFQSKFHYFVDLSSLDGTIGNLGAVEFRLANSSGVSVNSGITAASGTDRVDNFLVQGIPEPSTVMLVGLGLLGCLAAVRGRRS